MGRYSGLPYTDADDENTIRLHPFSCMTCDSRISMSMRDALLGIGRKLKAQPTCSNVVDALTLLE